MEKRLVVGKTNLENLLLKLPNLLSLSKIIEGNPSNLMLKSPTSKVSNSCTSSNWWAHPILKSLNCRKQCKSYKSIPRQPHSSEKIIGENIWDWKSKFWRMLLITIIKDGKKLSNLFKNAISHQFCMKVIIIMCKTWSRTTCSWVTFCYWIYPKTKNNWTSIYHLQRSYRGAANFCSTHPIYMKFSAPAELEKYRAK